MTCLIFIEGRGLSTRTVPLAVSNERNPTPHRLQTKQQQHKEPAISYKQSRVSTDVGHLQRKQLQKGPSLSTHHQQKNDGGTWTVPKRRHPGHASRGVHSAPEEQPRTAAGAGGEPPRTSTPCLPSRCSQQSNDIADAAIRSAPNRGFRSKTTPTPSK